MANDSGTGHNPQEDIKEPKEHNEKLYTNKESQHEKDKGGSESGRTTFTGGGPDLKRGEPDEHKHEHEDKLPVHHETQTGSQGGNQQGQDANRQGQDRGQNPGQHMDKDKEKEKESYRRAS